MALTPDQLRTVADTLDTLSKAVRVLYSPIFLMEQTDAATGEVTIKIDRNGEPMTPDEARMLVEWVESEEMQDDLRAWADELEVAS